MRKTYYRININIPLLKGFYMKNKRSILWATVLSCLLITFLPYFGFFNEAKLIAGIPQPLALILVCNVILTLCAIALYPLYFKPFIKKLAEKPLKEDK